MIDQLQGDVMVFEKLENHHERLDSVPVRILKFQSRHPQIVQPTKSEHHDVRSVVPPTAQPDPGDVLVARRCNEEAEPAQPRIFRPKSVALPRAAHLCLRALLRICETGL